MRAAIAIVALLLLTACVTIPGRTAQTPFDRGGPFMARATLLRF